MGSSAMVKLDGSQGEGGGQILRSALSLSLITGIPFHIANIRANRDKPGLRPQHLAAVQACAQIGSAEVSGAAVGSRELTFHPGKVQARDFSYDIGTAGASALVLHALALPLAMAADQPVRVAITGGTFNTKAPSYPFLNSCWRKHLAALGVSVAVSMPSAGYYPKGGGRIEAWIEPGKPRAARMVDRGPLVRIHGVAGVTNLRERDIARRMADRATTRLAENGLDAEIELAEWPGVGQGAAIALTAEYAGANPSTFVGLGERGKPADRVADHAVEELLRHHEGSGAVDPHSADQILMPLALAEGFSEYTTSEVTEHLRTNALTLMAFLDCEIQIDESGRVRVRGAG